MKRLLRSVIDVKGVTQENLIVNFQKLNGSGIEWELDEDKLIFEFLKSYFQEKLELPAIQTVVDYFTDDTEVKERLKDIVAAESYIRTNFTHLLKSLREKQNMYKGVALLKEAETIIKQGLLLQEGKEKVRKQGLRDGLIYFQSKANELILPEHNARVQGDIREDGQQVWDEYVDAKVNKDKAFGRFTGLNAIDVNCHGLKNGEMHVHAAFSGHLKCLSGDAVIFDYETNQYWRLDDLYTSQRLPVILAIENEGVNSVNLVKASTSHIIQNGIREVFELTLVSNLSIGATSNHKFLTPTGWKELKDLLVNEKVAIPAEGGKTIDWDKVKSIKLRGKEMTYDLSVPKHHSFVANGIVTHNTTFATNWCYNLVTRYRTNVFYGSFEMKYEHIRRLIYVLHSANNRWKGQEPHKHQCAKCPHPPLDYRKVRDGELSEEEELFYKLVIDDFCNNPEYCHFEIWCPAEDVSIDDVRLQAEMLHKQMEVGFAVLDHGGLMKARKHNSNYGVELNSVLRDSKKFALHFNHGQGIPTLMLFQTNRDGLSDADKNDGVYKMRALSWASEAERSADVVTTTYLDDQVPGGGTYRKNNQTKICNLKNRDNPLFEPFMATVNFKTRRIMNLDITEHTGQHMSVEDHQIMNTLMSQV